MDFAFWRWWVHYISLDGISWAILIPIQPVCQGPVVGLLHLHLMILWHIAMISSAKSLKPRYTDFVGLEYKSMTKYEEFLLIFWTPDFRYYIECINGKICMFTFFYCKPAQLSFTGNCYTHLINKPSPSDMKFPNCA